MDENNKIEENKTEEKKEMKISLKGAIIGIVIFVAVITIGAICIGRKSECNDAQNTNSNSKSTGYNTKSTNNGNRNTNTNSEKQNTHKKLNGNDIVPQNIEVDGKPIIYLYPTEETEVTVKLNKPEQITCSYPKYKNEWKVIAEPNGDLTYEETGRKLYSLYYESNNTIKFNVEKEGFVVKGEETAEFLEEKLALLGLTEREAEEFIVYWLPKLEENKYNYIRFATKEEIEENMPLEINPNPDTIIRVLMTYKGLNSPIEVEEQKLETPERTGFVAVEWGGTEIK